MKLHHYTNTVKILLLLIVLFCIIFNGNSVKAKSIDDSCAKVEVIFARGSGRDVTLNNPESSVFQEQLTMRLKGSLSPHYYELGKESYGNHKYPAVKVDDPPFIPALQAWVSSGTSGDYSHSVGEGVNEFKSYMSQRYLKCKSSGSYYILAGYSQGAQVIGEALMSASNEIKDKIAFVALFGDPKLFLPEGIGGIFSPACLGKVSSSYRRNPINCDLWQGRLHARLNYLSDDLQSKTGLWCNRDDFICGTSNNPKAPGHDQYANSGGAIDAAAREAAGQIKALFKSQSSPSNSPSPSPSTTPSPNPTPSPTPTPEDIDQLIDITHHFGDGTTGQNIEFLIDIQDSMQSKLPSIAASIKHIADQLNTSSNWHDSRDLFGVMAYMAQPSATVNSMYQPVWGGIAFADPNIIKYQYLDLLAGASGHPLLGSPLYAVERSLQFEPWRLGAAKSILLFTDKSTYPSPDYYGLTTQAIAKHALEIDPVNIYPVVPEDAADAFQELADKTSGQVITYTGNDPTTATNLAFAKIQQRPVVFLKLSQYIANPGQEITFDASDSYVIDSTITKYEWDFDGDGSFDTITTTPSANHTYSGTFDGSMQVRLTAANGTIANGSATVKVGTYVAPVLPKTPQNLKSTVITTEGDTATVRLTWDPIDDPLTASLALSLNGIMLGTMAPDRTSIDITDVDRTIDNDFSINAVDENQMFGDPAIVTLAKLQPPTSLDTNPQGAINSSNDTGIKIIAENGTPDSPVFIQKLDNLKREFGSKVKSLNNTTNHEKLITIYIWIGLSLVFAAGSWQLLTRIRRSR